jgi:hypothetical protein
MQVPAISVVESLATVAEFRVEFGLAFFVVVYPGQLAASRGEVSEVDQRGVVQIG